jgi:hypothetical protein
VLNPAASVFVSGTIKLVGQEGSRRAVSASHRAGAGPASSHQKLGKKAWPIFSITLARAYRSSSQHGGHDEHNALSLPRLRSAAIDRSIASYAYDGGNGKHLLEETRENSQHMVMPLRVSDMYLHLEALIKYSLIHVLPALIDKTK